MKFTKQFILTMALILFLAIPSIFASTITTTWTINNTAAVIGLGYDTGIAGVQLFLSATPDNNNTSSTTADATQVGWLALADVWSGNPRSSDKLQVFDTAFFPVVPMIDGTFATTTFGTSTDTVAGLSLVSWNFFDYSLSPVTISEVQLVNADFSDGGTVSFNVVPIPSTILLLGGGLVALVAVRRRRS